MTRKFGVPHEHHNTHPRFPPCPRHPLTIWGAIRGGAGSGDIQRFPFTGTAQQTNHMGAFTVLHRLRPLPCPHILQTPVEPHHMSPRVHAHAGYVQQRTTPAERHAMRSPANTCTRPTPAHTPVADMGPVAAERIRRIMQPSHHERLIRSQTKCGRGALHVQSHRTAIQRTVYGEHIRHVFGGLPIGVQSCGLRNRACAIWYAFHSVSVKSTNPSSRANWSRSSVRSRWLMSPGSLRVINPFACKMSNRSSSCLVSISTIITLSPAPHPCPSQRGDRTRGYRLCPQRLCHWRPGICVTIHGHTPVAHRVRTHVWPC